jgi:hypothetical protein
MFEIDFRIMSVDSESIALASLLESVRAGQHAIGVGGDLILASGYSVFLEKAVD